MKGLKNKRVLIAGDIMDVGEAVARRFLGAGARVAIIGLDEIGMDGFRGSLRGLELAVVTDLKDTEEVERAFRTLDGRWGRVDILINNVINSARGTGLKDAYFISRLGVERMKSLGGVVITLGEEISTVSDRDFSVKEAVKEWTRAMAIETAPKIRVNAVFSGNIRSSEATTNGHNHTDKLAAGEIPLGRMGEPEEVAALCVFLCSAEATYITGQSFTIDGGETSLGPEN